MPRTKKETAANTAAKAADTKTEELKAAPAESVADTKKEETKKTTRKTTARKTTTKKTPAKKAVTTEEKAAAKEGAEVSQNEVKAMVQLQFAGREITTEELVQNAKNVWEYDLNRNPEDFKSVELYVKPEESIVYYVINGDVTGSFGL